MEPTATKGTTETGTPERTGPVNDLSPFVRRAISAATVATALLILIHALAHVTGFLVLWGFVEPETLSYAEMTPDPRSTMGRLVGIPWLAAGVLFGFGALLLVRGHPRWWIATLAAAAISLAVLVPWQSGVPVGITADLVVVLFVLKVVARPRPAMAARSSR